MPGPMMTKIARDSKYNQPEGRGGRNSLPLLFLLHLTIASLSLRTEGTVVFHNDGTTSGWDGINQEHKGTVKQVTDVFYKGPSSLLMQQIYDSSYTGRYHSEVVKSNGYSRGDRRFYGFAFRLAPNWQFQPEQTYNIAQFIADFSDIAKACGDGYIPTTMVWLNGNQLQTRVKFGQVCDQRTTDFKNVATVTAGVWHRIEIQANWQSDNTGYFKLWFDGVKVLEQYNIATTLPDSRPIQFRVGLYANGWHDNGQNKGTQNVRQIWYDQIGAGTVFSEADPDGW